MGTSGGFRVDLEELRRAADESLPALAEVLRAQVPVLNAHEGLHGPGGRLPAAVGFQIAYAEYTDAIAARQRLGCSLVNATAEALRGIVTVYKRADGQG